MSELAQSIMRKEIMAKQWLAGYKKTKPIKANFDGEAECAQAIPIPSG
jgi:hypothetical protein